MRFQILDGSVSISYVNTLGKCVSSTIFPPAMGRFWFFNFGEVVSRDGIETF